MTEDEILVPLDESDLLAHCERQDQRIRELEAALEAALKENESLKEQIAALKEALKRIKDWPYDIMGDCVYEARSEAQAALTKTEVKG